MGSRFLLATASCAIVASVFGSGSRPVAAQALNPCGAAPTGARLPDPPQLTSTGGVLTVRMAMRQDRSAPAGTLRMCYAFSAVVDGVRREGVVPPTLAVRPGERIVMDLVNELPPTGNGMPMSLRRVPHAVAPARPPREPGEYHLITNYANVHFHGLNVSPIPPSDNVTTVLIPPGRAASYRYVIDIPRNEPGGLYWYHPHVHGESKPQVKAGLTGAILIVPSAGESVDSRVLVVRGVDAPVTARATAARKRAQRLQSHASTARRASEGQPQPLASEPFPFAPPAECPPPGPGGPNSEFLTVNGLNVPEPGTTTFPLPTTTLEEGQPQVWHIANTAAITYLDLTLAVDGRPVPLQLVGRDGIPVGPDNGGSGYGPLALDHVLLAPAGRADVLITGPQIGHTALLATRSVDTGCAGDTDGGRALVAIHGIAGPTIADARHATGRVAGAYQTRRNTRFANLAATAPVRQRRFVFTEYPLADGSRTDFYVTELSDPRAHEHPFKMSDGPSVVAKVGTTEDWVIENWTQEIHAFHIHQIHFKVLAGLPGAADGLGMLLDTVNVPYGGYAVRNGRREFVPGAVRLRMDFRDPQIVGDFVYHCHVLEHEDNGMMAIIRVVP